MQHLFMIFEKFLENLEIINTTEETFREATSSELLSLNT